MRSADQNIIENQEELYIHALLADDLAYSWSVDNKSVLNMQKVLRAYGEKFSVDAAVKQIEVALSVISKEIPMDEVCALDKLDVL